MIARRQAIVEIKKACFLGTKLIMLRNLSLSPSINEIRVALRNNEVEASNRKQWKKIV